MTSVPQIKRAYPETARHIRNAAAQVFAEQGYAGTTIADIAKVAQCTRPTVYVYYSSKEDIFQQLAEGVRQQFVESQMVPADQEPDQIIRQTALAFLSVYSANLGLLTIIQHQGLSDPKIGELWEQLYDGINRTHVRFMQRLLDDGHAEPAAPLTSIADAVIGVAMRFSQLISSEPELLEPLGEDLVSLHLRMLGLRPSQAYGFACVQ
jgi:AcrR family transcriptional regulator